MPTRPALRMHSTCSHGHLYTGVLGYGPGSFPFKVFPLHPIQSTAETISLVAYLFIAHSHTHTFRTSHPADWRCALAKERWVQSGSRDARESAPTVQEPGGGDRQPVHAEAIRLELAHRGRAEVCRIQCDAERGVGSATTEVQATRARCAEWLATPAVVPIHKPGRRVPNGQRPVVETVRNC